MTKVNQIIREEYKNVSDILIGQGIINSVPKLELTKARTFWGKIRKERNSGKYVDIRISYSSFQELYRHRGEAEFRRKLNETICHEIAHMVFWSHNSQHTALTERYKKITFGTQLITAASQVEFITLASLVDNPTKARAALRKAGIVKPGTKWEWTNEVPTDVKKILGL